MRGTDETTGSLFSHVDLEERIPVRHPLRKVRQIVNDALASLDAEFDLFSSAKGRPSIAPERLLRASLLQILFLVRSERQVMEQMQHNLLVRWFGGSWAWALMTRSGVKGARTSALNGRSPGPQAHRVHEEP